MIAGEAIGVATYAGIAITVGGLVVLNLPGRRSGWTWAIHSVACSRVGSGQGVTGGAGRRPTRKGRQQQIRLLVVDAIPPSFAMPFRDDFVSLGHYHPALCLSLSHTSRARRVDHRKFWGETLSVCATAMVQADLQRPVGNGMSLVARRVVPAPTEVGRYTR